VRRAYVSRVSGCTGTVYSIGLAFKPLLSQSVGCAWYSTDAVAAAIAPGGGPGLRARSGPQRVVLLSCHIPHLTTQRRESRPVQLWASAFKSAHPQAPQFIPTHWYRALATLPPGVTTDALDRICHVMSVMNGAYPSPRNYMGFPKSLCTSVNEVVCHGGVIRTSSRFKGHLIRCPKNETGSRVPPGPHPQICETWSESFNQSDWSSPSDLWNLVLNPPIWFRFLTLLLLHTKRPILLHPHPHQTVRSTTLFKLENRNPTRLLQEPNRTRLRGKSENVYTDFLVFPRSIKHKVRVPEYTFSLLPLNLVQFGFCTNLVRFA